MEVLILLVMHLVEFLFRIKQEMLLTGQNKLIHEKKRTKPTSCDCKSKFDGRKCNSNQKSNNDKCSCACKNSVNDHAYKKDYVWSPSACEIN